MGVLQCSSDTDSLQESLTPEVKSSVYKTAQTSDVSGEIPILLFDFAAS